MQQMQNQGYMPPPNQPPYMPPSMPQRNGLATASLVLGILSFVFMWVPIAGTICGFLSLIFGITSRKRRMSGEAIAGLILGGIGTALSIAIFATCFGACTNARGTADTGVITPAASHSIAVPSTGEWPPGSTNTQADIATILAWYESNSDVIATAATDFVASQEIISSSTGAAMAVSDITITQNDFEFNELLGCAYFIYFDCLVDSTPAHGHTTAFVEYLGKEITWIDLEIATDADGAVLLEWFDSEADDRSYEYYDFLIADRRVADSAPAPPSGVSQPEPGVITLVPGDTIMVDGLEITIRYVEYTDHAPLHIPDHNMFAASPYAEEGNILLDMCVDIKNTQTTAVQSHDFLDDVTLVYNTDYKYYFREYDEDLTFGLESTGFLSPVTIIPLETVELRYIVQAPMEVANNTAASLVLEFKIGGTDYQIVMR